MRGPLDQLIAELIHQGITHPEVLAAIRQIPRERFIAPTYKEAAYENVPLPIECEQTISQPYIVALMTQALLENGAKRKILEIGTGSGYQTAILASLFEEVWTVERHAPLQIHARQVLTELGFENIHYRVANGTYGWPEAAPFDGIMVTAAPPKIPPELIKQMDPDDSVMIIPVGDKSHGQQLMCVTQRDRILQETVLTAVRFVPLVHDKNKNNPYAK